MERDTCVEGGHEKQVSSSSYVCFTVSFTYLKKTPKIMPVLRTNIATNDDLVPHLTCTVAAPDLQIRGGDGHPDPEIRRTWS